MPDVSDGIHSCFGHKSFSRIVAMAGLQTTSASLLDRDRRERSRLAFAFGAYVFSPHLTALLREDAVSWQGWAVVI